MITLNAKEVTEDCEVLGICPCLPLPTELIEELLAVTVTLSILRDFEMTKLSSVFCPRFPDINIA